MRVLETEALLLRLQWARRSGRRTRTILAQAAVLALLVLAVGLPTARALSALLRMENEVLRGSLLMTLTISVSLSWVLALGFFRLPVTPLLDLRHYRGLPLSFRRLFLLRLGYSYFGLWLVFFGPALAASVAAAQGPLATTLFCLAALLWVATLNTSASLLAQASEELAIRWRGGLGSLALVLIGAWVSYRWFALPGKEDIAVDIGSAAFPVDEAGLVSVLPGGVPFGKLLQSPQEPMMWAGLLLLAGCCSFLVLFDYHFLRRRQTSPLRTVKISRTIGPWLLDRMSPLVAAELLVFSRSLFFRYGLFATVGYTPLMVFVFLEPGALTAAWCCAFPVLLWTPIKSNLLGSHRRSLPAHFIFSPAPGDWMRCKIAAINVVVAALCVSTLTLEFLSGGLDRWWQLPLCLSFAVGLVGFQDAVCLRATLAAPKPIDFDALFPQGGNQSGSTWTVIAIFVFVPLVMFGDYLAQHSPWVSLAVLGLFFALAAGGLAFRARTLRRFHTALPRERERVLLALRPGGEGPKGRGGVS